MPILTYVQRTPGPPVGRNRSLIRYDFTFLDPFTNRQTTIRDTNLTSATNRAAKRFRTTKTKTPKGP